jgi:hypothetical protein
LIERNTNKLHELAECKNDTHFKNVAPSTSLSDRVGTNRSLRNAVQAKPRTEGSEGSS